MVRIGRIDAMHEEVKKISVSELSKREAMKTFGDLQHKSREAVEQAVSLKTFLFVTNIKKLLFGLDYYHCYQNFYLCHRKAKDFFFFYRNIN